MNHQVEIVAQRDRSKGVCSCGHPFLERFGSERSTDAKFDLIAHLHKAYIYDESAREPEYQIGAKQDLVCPVCESDLDLTRDDFPLLDETTPTVVQCSEGHHQFDAYTDGKTLYLFTDGEDAGPFSTTR